MNVSLWIKFFKRGLRLLSILYFYIDGANQHFFLFPLSHLLLNLSYIWIVPQLHYFIGGAIFGVLVSLVLVNKLSNFLEVMWSATYNLAKFLPRQAHNSNSALKWGNYKLNFHFEESEWLFSQSKWSRN